MALDTAIAIAAAAFMVGLWVGVTMMGRMPRLRPLELKPLRFTNASSAKIWMHSKDEGC